MKKILAFTVLTGICAGAMEVVTLDPYAMQNEAECVIACRIVDYMRQSHQNDIEKQHAVKQFLDTIPYEKTSTIKKTLYGYIKNKIYPDEIKTFSVGWCNVKFNPYNDNTVTCVDKSRKLEVWDLCKQKKLSFDPPIKQGVHICRFLSKCILALQYLNESDGSSFDLELRNLSSGKCIERKKHICNYTMHPAKNDTLVVTDANGWVYERNLETKEVLGQQRNASRYSFSPHGSIAIVRNKKERNHITLLDALTKKKIVELDNVFSECTFNKEETLACVCHSYGTEKCNWYTFWDLKAGKPVIGTIYMLRPYDDLAFSPSTNIIAYPNAENMICLYDLKQKKSLSLPLPSIIQDEKYDGCQPKFNKDGTVLSIARKYTENFSEDFYDLFLIDPKTKNYIFEISAVAFYALNPSGTILCTCDKDNVLSIWNIATQEKMGTLFQSSHSRSLMHFINDNLLYIWTPMQKNKDLIWDVEKNKCVKESRAAGHRCFLDSSGVSFNELEMSRYLTYIKEGSFLGEKVIIWGLQHPEALSLEELLYGIK